MTIGRAAFWVFLGNGFAVALALVSYHQDGQNPFGERGFITFLSTFQLLAIACLSDKIDQAKKGLQDSSHQSRTRLWNVIAWGFIFLAADEFLAIHEVTDLFIHDIFNWRETGLSDRIDDLILGLYGVAALWLLWAYRREFRPYKPAIALFKRGFILMFLMVGLDIFANGQELLEIFFAPDIANTIQQRLSQVEDSLKMFAEAFFVLAFYSILRTVKRTAKQLEPLQKTYPKGIEQVRR